MIILYSISIYGIYLLITSNIHIVTPDYYDNIVVIINRRGTLCTYLYVLITIKCYDMEYFIFQLLYFILIYLYIYMRHYYIVPFIFRELRFFLFYLWHSQVNLSLNRAVFLHVIIIIKSL